MSYWELNTGRKTQNSKKTMETRTESDVNPLTTQPQLTLPGPPSGDQRSTGSTGETPEGGLLAPNDGSHIRRRKVPKEKFLVNPDLLSMSQGTEHLDLPNSNSTPLASPNAFEDRRSPNDFLGLENSDNGMELAETPLGAGANHNLLTDVELDQIIVPENPTADQLRSTIEAITGKIEQFGLDFRNQVGWIGRFEAHGKLLKSILVKISDNCFKFHHLELLETVVVQTQDLETHLNNMRGLARAEKETQQSPYNFRPPLLRVNDATLETNDTPRSDTTVRQRAPAEQRVNDGNNTQTVNTRNENLQSIPKTLKNLQEKVQHLESYKADKRETWEKFQNLDASKASKEEIRSLNEGIKKVDKNVRELAEQDLAGQINLNKNGITANAAAGKRYENLAKGFCDEIVRLRAELAEVQDQMGSLTNKVDTITGAQRVQTGNQNQLIGQESTDINGINPLPLGTSASNLNTVRFSNTTARGENLTGGTTAAAGQLQAPPANTTSLPPTRTNTSEIQGHGGNPSTENISQDTHRSNGSQREILDISGSSAEGSSIVSEEEILTRTEYRLKCAGRGLKKMLDPPTNSKLTRSTVIGIHKTLLPAIDQERRELQHMIDKYENPTGRNRIVNVNRVLADEMQGIVEEARTWAREMRHKYNELDCSKRPLDGKLYESLERFGDSSETNIFEFLNRFEAYTEEKGTAKERADLLYEMYLHKDVQMMLIERKGDYELMRSWLINRYGDVKVMTANILKTMKKEQIPSDQQASVNLTKYYRKLNSVIKKISELRKTVDMPVKDLEEHMYSNEFLNQILSYVPEKAKFEFFDKLMILGDDLLRIKGKSAFNTLSVTVYKHFCINESASKVDDSSKTGKTEKPPPKRERKSAHSMKVSMAESDTDCSSETDDEESDDDEDNGAHFQNTSNSYSKGDGVKSKTINNKTYKFPCGLKNHNHELGECTDFFKMSPIERRKKLGGKNCWTCLGSYENCKQKCIGKMPNELVCRECKKWADQNKKSALNVFFCNQKDHPKPKNSAMTGALKKYLRNFSTKNIQEPIKLAAHLYMAGHTKVCTECKTKSCNCRPTTLTSKPNPKMRPPIINTKSGESITDKVKIIQESDQDSFYVMQILNLRGQDVLTFYDRGANQHLIDGKLAEDISLKVVTDKSVSIGVVGGSKIWTKYGSYSLVLGPTKDDYYFKVSAQGIEQITTKFPHYNLETLNKEVLETNKALKIWSGKKTLPKYIGGQPARLLIGIKSTGLEPTLLFQLPCGLGVYESPLQDKFGSRICYGGPHEVFSQVNKKVGNNFNHVNIYFTQMINQYRDSPYPRLASILNEELEDTGFGAMLAKEDAMRSKICTNDGYDLYPTAINEIDMQDLGVQESRPMDLEEDECICEHTHLERIGKNKAVYKAKIPVAKRKEYVDEEDQGLIKDFRCTDCARCKKCSLSDRSKMMSLQEKMEQEAIKKSVTINLKEHKVFVDLPFIKPPIPALKKRHNGEEDNFKQAHKIYQTQCRKPQHMKDEIIKVQADLVHRGFMKKLDELDEDQRNLVQNAGFRHYMPWRIAEKPDSLSTPYRMVVDASVTGLNEILAKGENRISKIHHILIRNRCRKFIWSSDISKLYNQLHLNDSALPYGLFLFNDKLEVGTKPEIYVMLVAWYGVSSTGNQSAEALEQLAAKMEEKYPAVTQVVKEDLYVDDTLSGSNNKETMVEQIDQTKKALKEGGFNLKYVVKSGEKPCEEASTDGNSLKILGYKWYPEEDILNPGFGEINFNKKRRGSKIPNPFPVINPEDVTKLLESTNVTRRMVVSKIAEIWDPVGIWEPYKLQLKLDNHSLNGLDWDLPLDTELQEHWKTRFQQFLELPKMTATRCVVPTDAIDPDEIRLLCISDAAEQAGGCAIYAGYQRKNGKYSCKLLTSRSKLMNQKIPRNELEGIKLMAETADSVKKALGDKVKETLYFTDSTIAMCWCHNTSKKLRMYTMYRVADIRRLILGSADSSLDQELPLYHIDGKLNTADLLTKYHNITPKDLGSDSQWQNGMTWMELPKDNMPITSYQDLIVSPEEEGKVNLECFPEPILSAKKEAHHNSVSIGEQNCSHCSECTAIGALIPNQVCYGKHHQFDHCNDCECPVKISSFALKVGRGSQMLIDIIKHGWSKSLKILTRVHQFAYKAMHQSHIKKGVMTHQRCQLCQAISETAGIDTEIEKFFICKSKDYLFRQETKRIKLTLSKKKIDGFIEQNGILYYESRLNEENPITTTDLDIDVFFDNLEIKTMLPVVLSDSDLFFAHAMYIHCKVRPHSGVELTMREIAKTMMVVNNPRRIIQRIRKDCTKCRMIAKKTLELRMMNHPSARTNITPPFYHCQMDTVFGFKGQCFKNSRKTMKLYALVIVCLLTGATNILALEGLETQDVIQAIERHASRHGVPCVIYVDNGTQLVALDNTKFCIRDLQAQVKDSYGLKVIVSNAKSHEERGRVEAKVKILRNMLEKLSVKTETVMTALQWETLFAKISNMIDDVPIAKGNDSKSTDPGWDLITANRLKLGRNNNRSLEGWIDLSKGTGSLALLKRNQEIQRIWYQMLIDKIHHLIPRPRKWNRTDEINVGDICLFTYNEGNYTGKDIWKIGRILSIPKKNQVIIEFPGNKIVNGLHKLRTITRNPRNISIISAVEEIDQNSRAYFENLKLKEETS